MTTEVALAQDAENWIKDRITEGQVVAQVADLLRRGGWPKELAEQATMQVWMRIFGVPNDVPKIHSEAGTIKVYEKQIRVVSTHNEPPIWVLDNVLTDHECDELIAGAELRLERSTTVNRDTGDSQVDPVRTSDGMFYELGETSTIKSIEKRIAQLVSWPLEKGEALQLLRYKPGNKYEPHHDYFDPRDPGSPKQTARGGQRVGTLIMYLNDPIRGGETVFPDIGLKVTPAKGRAVLFTYAIADESSKTLHGGAPLVEGEKWIATKWLRANRFA